MIDRETALQILTDAGCPNGYLASFALHHPQWDWMQHALNAAVSPSRKDAEPVAWKLSFADEDGISHREVFHSHKHLQEHVRHNSEIRGLKCRVTPLYTSPLPPEADKLPPDVKTAIEMCLAHYGNDPRVEPLRTYLEGKK